MKRWRSRQYRFVAEPRSPFNDARAATGARSRGGGAGTDQEEESGLEPVETFDKHDAEADDAAPGYNKITINLFAEVAEGVVKLSESGLDGLLPGVHALSMAPAAASFNPVRSGGLNNDSRVKGYYIAFGYGFVRFNHHHPRQGPDPRTEISLEAFLHEGG